MQLASHAAALRKFDSAAEARAGRRLSDVVRRPRVSSTSSVDEEQPSVTIVPGQGPKPGLTSTHAGMPHKGPHRSTLPPVLAQTDSGMRGEGHHRRPLRLQAFSEQEGGGGGLGVGHGRAGVQRPVTVDDADGPVSGFGGGGGGGAPGRSSSSGGGVGVGGGGGVGGGRGRARVARPMSSPTKFGTPGKSVSAAALPRSGPQFASGPGVVAGRKDAGLGAGKAGDAPSTTGAGAGLGPLDGLEALPRAVSPSLTDDAMSARSSESAVRCFFNPLGGWYGLTLVC
jgi:hypothetical protein